MARTVAAKTIEETAKAEPGPTLRGQLASGSPVVLPNSAACCSPRCTWDGCDRRHPPTPSRSPAASTATCSLLHLQAVTPFQRSASLAEDERRYQRALTPRRRSLQCSEIANYQPDQSLGSRVMEREAIGDSPRTTGAGVHHKGRSADIFDGAANGNEVSWRMCHDRTLRSDTGT